MPCQTEKKKVFLLFKYYVIIWGWVEFHWGKKKQYYIKLEQPLIHWQGMLQTPTEVKKPCQSL
jgi:hypothetical protein